jgi:hypothetical protein
LKNLLENEHNAHDEKIDSAGAPSKQIRNHGTLILKPGEIPKENKSLTSGSEGKAVKASSMPRNEEL